MSQFKFFRKKQKWECKPIAEAGVYEIKEYHPDDFFFAKEDGIPFEKVLPQANYKIIVYAVEAIGSLAGELLWEFYNPDESEGLNYLHDWGEEEWEGIYEEVECTFIRKIAKNPNLIYTNMTQGGSN